MIPINVVDDPKRESQVINLINFVSLWCKAELEENTNCYFTAGVDPSNANLGECMCKARLCCGHRGMRQRAKFHHILFVREQGSTNIKEISTSRMIKDDEHKSSRHTKNTAQLQSKDEKCPFAFFVLCQDPPKT
jgi:hypothetical protein